MTYIVAQNVFVVVSLIMHSQKLFVERGLLKVNFRQLTFILKCNASSVDSVLTLNGCGDINDY